MCSAAAALLERTKVDDAVANAYNSVVIKAILMAGATRFNYRISTEWRDVEEVLPNKADHTPLFSHGEWHRKSDVFPSNLNVVSLLDSGWKITWDLGGVEPTENRKYRLQVSEDEQFSTREKEVFVDMNTYTYPAPTEWPKKYFRVYTYPKDGDVAYCYPSLPHTVQSTPRPE